MAEGYQALPSSGPSARQAWLLLGLLLVLHIHSQWARAIIYYVVSFTDTPQGPEDAHTPHTHAKPDAGGYMNEDLGFGKEDYSLLASLGFTISFLVGSLLAGRVADAFDRGQVLALGVLAWSLTVGGTGLANSFAVVFALRVGMGVSMAFLAPQALAMISSAFSDGAATAASVYATGVYLGGALASLTILLDEEVGWRSSFFIAGLSGLVLAGLAFLLLRDTGEGGSGGGGGGGKGGEGFPLTVQGTLDAVRVVLGIRHVQLLYLATAVRYCAGFGIGVWVAPFFREKYPDRTGDFSVANALVIAGGGIISSVAGGALADRLAQQDPRYLLLVPAAGSLIAAPLWFLAIHARTFAWGVTWLFLEYLAAECWFGPALAALTRAVPREAHGTALGVFTVLSSVGNVLPVVIGFLQRQLGFAEVLCWTVVGAYVVSGLLFVLAGMNPPDRLEGRPEEETE